MLTPKIDLTQVRLPEQTFRRTEDVRPARETEDEAAKLSEVYRRRFQHSRSYRQAVWGVLVKELFQNLIKPSSTVLDLGCGYGEFINNVVAARKFDWISTRIQPLLWIGT